MRNVIFIAPFAFETTCRFAEAAASHPDTRLVLLSHDPVERFPRRLREKIGGHWRVGNALDPETLIVAVEAIRRRLGPIHGLLGTLEQLQEPLAFVRGRLGLPGMTVEVARRLRDPARLAAALREAGAPSRPGEEMGRELEHSFDGVMLDGQLIWHSLTRTLPPPAAAEKAPRPWCVLLPREADGLDDDVQRVATATFTALGVDTGVCHLEWRRRADGSLAVSDVGARPGGAWVSKLISYAHDVSFYRAWAAVMIDGALDPPVRRFAAGAASLRGGFGRASRDTGLERFREELGDLVVESNLPLEPGSTSSYEDEGYVILCHAETATVREALGRWLTLARE